MSITKDVVLELIRYPEFHYGYGAVYNYLRILERSRETPIIDIDSVTILLDDEEVSCTYVGKGVVETPNGELVELSVHTPIFDVEYTVDYISPITELEVVSDYVPLEKKTLHEIMYSPTDPHVIASLPLFDHRETTFIYKGEVHKGVRGYPQIFDGLLGDKRVEIDKHGYIKSIYPIPFSAFSSPLCDIFNFPAINPPFQVRLHILD